MNCVIWLAGIGLQVSPPEKTWAGSSACCKEFQKGNQRFPSNILPEKNGKFASLPSVADLP